MKPGYIYILQNKAYGSYVVKIGLTTRQPSIRAREIYAGSSGVPMPFEIAVAFSVADCERAEKQIHKRLAVYRLNRRREFFRLSPAVAAKISYETCAQINAELACPQPEPIVFLGATAALRRQDNVAEINKDEVDGKPIEFRDPRTLTQSSVGTSSLTAEQLDRARILYMNLGRVNPVAQKEWLEGFYRDEQPEREIRIWEHIAKAYLTVDEIEVASDELKREAFQLLMMRSWNSTEKVLKGAKFALFIHKTAKHLLCAYELPPKPVIIRRG